MNPQELVGIGSALAGAMLALMPVYQKFRAIRRTEDVADHESGIDKFRQNVKTAVSATFQNRESLVVMALSLLILGGLFHNAIKGMQYGAVIDAHYRDFQQVKALIEQRYGETRAQRDIMIQSLHRIEERLQRTQ